MRVATASSVSSSNRELGDELDSDIATENQSNLIALPELVTYSICKLFVSNEGYDSKVRRYANLSRAGKVEIENLNY